MKHSTERSTEISEIEITELNRRIGFNFKKSVTNQLDFARLYSEGLNSMDYQSPTKAFKSLDISVDENISYLSRVNQVYGINDSQKYSGKTQRWEGYVLEIQNDHFVARLDDLTNPGTHEQIRFDLDEVSPEDESLLELGATFYFSIGYVLNNGQREKTSLLRFKRIAEWTEEEFDRASDRSRKLIENLKWD